MKIVKTCGCICDNIEIDGKDIEKFSKYELKEILIKIIDSCSENKGILKSVMSDILDQVGEYKYLYTCDECGDSVYEYSIFLNQ